MTNLVLLGDARRDAKLVPFIDTLLVCGFPSPADDYRSELVDLNQLMLRHPDASFLARAVGESMRGAGIHDGDVLAVDRSMRAEDGDIVVAHVEGEFTVKRMRKQPGSVTLVAENPDFQPIVVQSMDALQIWGVVVAVLHPLVGESRRGKRYRRG